MFVALLLFIAVVISMPLIMVGTECLIALFVGDKPLEHQNQLAEGISYKLLIPAHNEAAIIATTIGALIPELPDANPNSIVLIADNCTDNTAAIAKSLGINVLERKNNTERGKGYALDHGIQYLQNHTPPDVLIILDADCVTSKQSLINLINTVIFNHKPAQMIYIMRPQENAALKQKIAGFAWILKNKVRLIAMNALGFPVTLTGTGMAFPWQAFEKVKIGHGNIVEDMQLGIDCAINGFPPVLCSNAEVYSDFPEQPTAELSQRTRWEHGHLQTILQQVPTLIKASWRQKKPSLLAYAFDVGVPPLSLLVVIVISALLFLMICSFITTASAAFSILLLSLLYFTAMLALVWRQFGTEYLTATEIVGIPNYIFSKLSIYFSFIFKRQKEWVRTNRD